MFPHIIAIKDKNFFMMYKNDLKITHLKSKLRYLIYL